MRLHRFIDNFALDDRNVVISDKGFCAQIVRVLRLRTGMEIILADGRLNEARARILAATPSRVEVEIIERFQNTAEPRRKVFLYCSILRRENFEWAAQKATEAGASVIIPVIAERTVKYSFKEDRVRTIIREAAEQSGRGIVPELWSSMTFDEAIRHAATADQALLFDDGGEPFVPLSFVVESAILWIGPEGGWTQREVEAAQREGFSVLSLGATTLRAETAALVATYLTTR